MGIFSTVYWSLYLIIVILFGLILIPEYKKKMANIKLKSLKDNGEVVFNLGESYHKVEMANIVKEIELAKYKALESALKNSNLNIVSDDMSFMGFDPKSIVSLGAMIRGMNESHDVDINKFIEELANKIGDK